MGNGKFTPMILGMALLLTGCTDAAQASGPDGAVPQITSTTTTSTEDTDELATSTPAKIATTQTPTALAPLSAEQIESATVPPLCEKPSGRLVHGGLPGIPPNEGHVDLAEGGIRQVDLIGDASPQLLAIFDCSAGGVAWPEALVLYTPGPTPRASIELGDLPLAQEHVYVVGAQDVPDGLYIVLSAFEGAGADFNYWSGVLTYDGTTLNLVDVNHLAGPFSSF